MEQRCAAYEALKEQIHSAERNGVISEAGGTPIFDKQGDLLCDLYQYCIYQFPQRHGIPGRSRFPLKAMSPPKWRAEVLEPIGYLLSTASEVARGSALTFGWPNGWSKLK